jgi:predicted RND superfamily exporter protein
VFDARDAIDERFVSQVSAVFVITEARSGDLLTAEGLRELRDRSAALRADPNLGPTLFSYFDEVTGVEVEGTYSIADLVDGALPGGLDAADDAQVKAAVAALVERFGADSDELGLSQLARLGPGGWVSPAITQLVLADNTALGFAIGGVDLGGDTESEEYSRDVVEALRGDEALHQSWGVAIDVNLTSNEQGEAAGPFIGFTILAVLIVVGVTFRSYWVLAVSGVALGALIVWLKGISNLLGLKDDLILSLIVPIAMISFGVDFAFHAVGRYREERRLGVAPRPAFTIGITAVVGALVLALASDAAAFLSNVSSGIESIIQFGIGAAVALSAAFLLLGIVTPLVVARIEAKVGTPPASRLRTFARINAAVLAGLLSMATVLLMVFILPVAGVIALGVQIIATLVVPYALARPREAEALAVAAQGAGRASRAVGRAIAAVAGQRRWVAPLAAAVTVAAAFLAVQVPTEFDVKDFFAADTDFVVSLDKLDEHVGGRAGEPAQLYVAAPLDQPEVLAAVAGFVDDVRGLDATEIARDDGGVRIFGGVFGMIDAVWDSPAAQGALTQFTGATLTDTDGDGLPDTEEQLDALYAFTRQAGVPFDATRLAQTPDEVRTSLWVADDGAAHATVFSVGLVNSRAQEAITAARDALEPVVADLRADLSTLGVPHVVEATGPPIVRQAGLEAISRALQVSLPIAVVLCFLIAAAFMRSVRLAAVVVVPILMTVAWLYAFMEVFGFAINVVTATIGAVSIGIGIDFAIHYTMRYREELGGGAAPLEAVRVAGDGTGTALIASASSSIVGFAILGFAPMPLFASYGFLTAVMILMALGSSLLVLPGLLVLVTRRPAAA